jgi:FKBP-type peptidyl-prolyl cis-trans isomerase (trigger factor)
VEKILDELKTRARQDAVAGMKLAFVMEKLAEKIEVEVDEGEVNAQIAAIARRQDRRFDRVRDELIKQGGLDNLYLRIRDEKIIAKLLEKAKVTETRPESKPEGEAADKKEQSGVKANADAAEQTGGEAGEAKPAKVKRTPPKKTPKASDDTADAT